MSKKKKAPVDVQSFGGTQDLGKTNTDLGLGKTDYEVSSAEAQSKTNLEMDEGHGDAVIIRRFEFAMNAEAFRLGRPDKQQLFNYHIKGLEVALWKDGLKVFPDVAPRLVIDEKSMKYSIFVAAKVARGHMLGVNPQTLSQLAHG